MPHILVIFAIVSFQVSGDIYHPRPVYEWQSIGVFADVFACENAARMMGIDSKRSRCLPTGLITPKGSNK